jgi:peptide/nickel transport system substrate-binding protein
VTKGLRFLGTAVLALAVAVALNACGSSNSNSTGSGSSSSGVVTLLMGAPPDSLDPQAGYTSQSAEATWISYLGLLTYAHKNGTEGGKIIPGLATALPTVSDGDKTYTFTLRKGLVFSNGQPVVASDFTYTVQRAIKIPWGGSGQFINANIVGAEAYASGKAKTISGITANDATGQIVIHLNAPYGAFENVLAFPALGIVPAGTPMKKESTDPPPGVGPYEIENIVPNVSFEVVKNPHWAQMQIPGVPAGHVNVDVKITSNPNTEFEQVLDNSADVADWSDTVPGTLFGQIESQAKSRYQKVVMNSTYFFFLNVTTKPFSSELARRAVVVALNQPALSRIGSGSLVPGCFFLPPGMLGHPSGKCPYGEPTSPGNIPKAQELVAQSGMKGTAVTVWSETRAPHKEWVENYVNVLNQIGFKATQKVIADESYFPTIGNLKLNPQTGFDNWSQDFPNPVDFYLQLTKQAILPENNENYGVVDDPMINKEVEELGKVPTSQLQSVAGKWQALDEYVAKKSYIAVFGYQTFPKFTSTRINYGDIVFHPVYGWDYTSFQLNS